MTSSPHILAPGNEGGPRELWKIHRAAMLLDVSDDQVIRLARKYTIDLHDGGTGSRSLWLIAKDDIVKLQRAIARRQVQQAVRVQRSTPYPSRYSRHQHTPGERGLRIA